MVHRQTAFKIRGYGSVVGQGAQATYSSSPEGSQKGAEFSKVSVLQFH